MPQQLLTIEETARLLRLPVSTLFMLKAKGRAPLSIKIGRRVFFTPEAIEDYLRSLETAARGAE